MDSNCIEDFIKNKRKLHDHRILLIKELELSDDSRDGAEISMRLAILDTCIKEAEKFLEYIGEAR